MTAEPSLSLAVCRAVAAAENVDALDLSPPLHGAVDPDALDRLFRDGSGELTFAYHGYAVTVTGGGTVVVDPLEAD